MKRKFLLLLIGLCCTVTLVQAQEEEEAPPKTGGFKKENLFAGGSISLNVANRYFLIGANPIFGYKIARWMDLGTVVNFQYYSIRTIFNNGERYKNTTAGLGLFTRLYPVNFIFLQAQPEVNYIFERYTNGLGGSAKDNYAVGSFLVGAGYKTGFSRADENTFGFVAVLYDVAKNQRSPYNNVEGNAFLVIRAGFQVALGR
jgi:hypothetical protein